MKPVHVEQLRDALGHHVSGYKGALKAHHAATDPAQKAALRGAADQHLNRIVPLLHLAGKASKHSGGQMVLDYPSMTPWETNYTSTERLPNGKLKEGTKDLGRRIAPNANRSKNSRAVPDYRYLEMAPHPGHTAAEKMSHKGGYPFEEIQLGHPSKRDMGQAYLPIEDREVKGYEPHPFDAHPINRFADHSQHDLGPEHHEQINSGLAGWTDSEHHKKWLSDQKAKHATDPEAYKIRGHAKPKHAYEGIPLSEMEHHKNQPAAAAAQGNALEEQKAQPRTSSKKVAPNKGPELSPEDTKLIAQLSPALRRKLGY